MYPTLRAWFPGVKVCVPGRGDEPADLACSNIFFPIRDPRCLLLFGPSMEVAMSGRAVVAMV